MTLNSDTGVARVDEILCTFYGTGKELPSIYYQKRRAKKNVDLLAMVKSSRSRTNVFNKYCKIYDQ